MFETHPFLLDTGHAIDRLLYEKLVFCIPHTPTYATWTLTIFTFFHHDKYHRRNHYDIITVVISFAFDHDLLKRIIKNKRKHVTKNEYVTRIKASVSRINSLHLIYLNLCHIKDIELRMKGSATMTHIITIIIIIIVIIFRSRGMDAHVEIDSSTTV